MGSRRKLVSVAVIVAACLAGCGDGGSERVFKVTGIDPCFEKVVVQVTQFGTNGEAQTATVGADGTVEAKFSKTFVTTKPATIRVWPVKIKAKEGCEGKKLNVPYVKEVTELPESSERVEVTVAAGDQKDAKISTGQPDDPKFPGQDGVTPSAPETDNSGQPEEVPPAGKVKDPTGLRLDPRADRAIKRDADAHPDAGQGSAKATGPGGDYVLEWERDAAGVFHAQFLAPPGRNPIRGAWVAFYAEPDGCAKSVFYQWVRQTLIWDDDPKTTAYVDSAGTGETTSKAPQVDKQAPYPAQHPGAAPYAEDVPGVPKDQTAGQLAVKFEQIAPGKAPPSPSKLDVRYDFWTYLICIDPYYVVGHYEWGFDLKIDIKNNKIVTPDPRVKPAMTWVAGR